MNTHAIVVAMAALSVLLGGTACSAKDTREPIQKAAPASPTPATPADSADVATALFAPAYWRLTELRGKPIARKGESQRDPSIAFAKDGNTVSGFAGCNTFGGGFEYGPNDRLRFTQVFATQMACPDMTLEAEFLQVLDGTDSFHVADGILVLHRARMAPLARFEAVADAKK